MHQKIVFQPCAISACIIVGDSRNLVIVTDTNQASNVRSWRIVLKKSVFGRRTKFFGTADAFHTRRPEGDKSIYANANTNPCPCIVVLRNRMTAERDLAIDLRKIFERPIFGFSTVSAKRTFGAMLMSAMPSTEVGACQRLRLSHRDRAPVTEDSASGRKA